MKYRNLVTGAVIDTPSPIKGKNWEEIGGKAEKPTPVIPDEPEVVEEEVKPVKKPRKTTKKTTK